MMPYEKPERAVVTGGCGFLGQALVRTLLEKGIAVTVIDLLEKENVLPKRKGLDFQPNVWQGDTEGKYDVFYHLAWAGSAGEGRKDGFLQAENIHQSVEALTLAKKLGCHTFVFAGSIMEAEVAAAEQAGLPPKGTDCYALAKETAAKLTCALAREGGIRHVTGRITNAYGVGERSDRLICRLMNAWEKGEVPPLTAGTQLYDFLYVTDAARAFAAIGKKGKDGKTYVVGSGKPRPLREWLEEAMAVTGGQAAFGKVPFSGISLTEGDFDTAELERDTGFCCRVSFAEGIRRLWHWRKEEQL